jgi:curved DNA-binding protein CbpA
VPSPYEVLGVDPDADETEVDRAYRRRVKEAHPDQGGSPEAFQAVRDAYEAITSGEAAPPARDVRDAPSEGDADDDEPTECRVEYLDYAVVTDRGWSLDDPDLFERAAAADLDSDAYGKFLVTPGESLLEAAENRGFAWPYACRGGACANCAVAVVSGELERTVDNILRPAMRERGIRLSCIGHPVTDDLQVVYNVKTMPDLDDLRLPADRFERAYSGD